MSVELLEASAAGVGPIVEVRALRDAAELDALRDPWNALAGDIPFRQHEWLATWQRHFGQPLTLHALACYDAEGQLAGLAPLCSAKRGARDWTALGSGRVCSDYQTLLARPGAEREVAAATAGWLRREAAGQWRSLTFDGIAADDRAIPALAAEIERQGGSAARRQNTCAWRTALPETWDAFVMQFTKRRRTTVRQLYRRVFEERQAEVRLVQTPADLDEVWPILVELHQKRQRSVGHAGCFRTPEFGPFLREAAERFLAQGQLRMQWLYLNGRPAAAQFDLVGGDTQYHYLSGMEPELLAERPGRLGMLVALHRALEEGLRTYDFLRGDHRYKSDWLAEPTPLTEWRLGAPSWQGRLSVGLTRVNWSSRAAAKKLLARLRSHS